MPFVSTSHVTRHEKLDKSRFSNVQWESMVSFYVFLVDKLKTVVLRHWADLLDQHVNQDLEITRYQVNALNT